MTADEGPVINLYAPGSWDLETPHGKKLKLVQETTYPVDDQVTITVHQNRSAAYTISLRIPAWSKETEILVNGESIPAKTGEYARISREWKDGDKISLKLDLRGRLIQSPGNVNALAVMRGPVVLAMDNRMVDKADYNLWLYADNTKWTHADDFGGLDYVLPEPVNSSGNDVFIELKPAASKPSGVWMAFEVPFLYRHTHFFDHRVEPLVLCDYASAGNEYSTKNLFRVWIPQPLYMNDIFPENTWKILYRGEHRPEFPEMRKELSRENPWDKPANR
jgi:hypothetical protein